MIYVRFYSGVHYTYILIKYVYYECIKHEDTQVDMCKSRQN